MSYPIEKELCDTDLPPFPGNKLIDMSEIDFLSGSSKPIGQKLRTYWNGVFRQCRLSHNRKKDIRARFRDKRVGQHYGALFELFLYELFHYMGHKISGEYSPKKSGPDYKIYPPMGKNFYLEATCQLGKIPSKSGEGYWKIKIYEAMQSIESSHFRLLLDFKGKLHGDINKRKIITLKNKVISWLSDLDYSNLSNLRQRTNNFEFLIKKQFLLNDLKLILRPLPLIPPKPSNGHNMVLVGPSYSYRDTTAEHLWKKLELKAKQCKGTRLGNIIAINVLDTGLDNYDIIESLFGKMHSKRPKIDPKKKKKKIDNSDYKGLWRFDTKSINSGIKAVMFFYKIDWFAMPAKKPIIVINPFVDTSDIPYDLPHFNYYIPKKENNFYELIPLKEHSDSDDTKWRRDWPIKI